MVVRGARARAAQTIGAKQVEAVKHTCTLRSGRRRRRPAAHASGCAARATRARFICGYPLSSTAPQPARRLGCLISAGCTARGQSRSRWICSDWSYSTLPSCRSSGVATTGASRYRLAPSATAPHGYGPRSRVQRSLRCTRGSGACAPSSGTEAGCQSCYSIIRCGSCPESPARRSTAPREWRSPGAAHTSTCPTAMGQSAGMADVPRAGAGTRPTMLATHDSEPPRALAVRRCTCKLAPHATARAHTASRSAAHVRSTWMLA